MFYVDFHHMQVLLIEHRSLTSQYQTINLRRIIGLRSQQYYNVRHIIGKFRGFTLDTGTQKES